MDYLIWRGLVLLFSFVIMYVLASAAYSLTIKGQERKMAVIVIGIFLLGFFTGVN